MTLCNRTSEAGVTLSGSTATQRKTATVIQGAIGAGSQVVAKSLKSLASPDGWRLDEVSASFGITLTAEAGVIVSKASAGASIEVSVKFTRAES